MDAPVPPQLRINFGAAQRALRGDSSLPQPTDTIYYLKTETPHLHDFSLFGTLDLIAAIVPSIRKKPQQTIPTGLKMSDEMMSTTGLSSFEYIVAPLPGGHSMTIRLIREQNAAVAATLPGPVWYVACAEGLSSDSTPSN